MIAVVSLISYKVNKVNINNTQDYSPSRLILILFFNNEFIQIIFFGILTYIHLSYFQIFRLFLYYFKCPGVI